jgi:pilus assembly protein CpaC
VRPQAPDRPLKTPLDNRMSSNDKELFLHGKLEVTKELAEFIETGGNLDGPFGHIIDLPGGSNNAVVK